MNTKRVKTRNSGEKSEVGVIDHKAIAVGTAELHEPPEHQQRRKPKEEPSSKKSQKEAGEETVRKRKRKKHRKIQENLEGKVFHKL